MPISSALKRVIASWLVVAFFISQTVTFDISFSKPVIEEYGIVAILVESDLYNDTGSYDGLSDSYGSYLSADTIAERIDRYAYDVQSELAMTKSLIIQVQSEDTVSDISAMLERLYFDGDDIENEKNHLTGVVVVGDIPLPVVTKSGNKFLSMLPYTDFEDKIYIYNQSTGNFERNSSASELEPEIWHGVIVPPSDDQDEGAGQLAEYFDKNHLYHLGVTEYSEFEQKLFYGDMVAEEKAINKASFEAYDRYTENWENIAYSRYTRHLAKALFIQAGGSISDGDGIDNDGDGLTDEDPADGIDNDGDGLLDEDIGDPFNYIDNDQDGLIDEDGIIDNDNDADGFYDEDPLGDANADGCPGTCGIDDDGDSYDSDNDGWPTGLEILTGWNPFKKSSPFLFKLKDDGLKAKWKKEFTDEDPFYCSEGDICWVGISRTDSGTNYEGELVEGNIHYDPRCRDSDGVFHPEWDDDEDGYCDEDTETDNDADGDGTASEDMFDYENSDTSAFDALPDIQSKNLFDQFTKKYYSLFDKLIAQIQDFTDYTGRYTSHYVDEDGLDVSDLDSPMSLIGKKDQYTITYLRDINDAVEEQVDSVVDTVQKDVKIIANADVQLTINFEGADEDDDGEPDGSGPSLDGDPIFFVNHSVSSRSLPFNVTIYGNEANEITSVKQCSYYLGSYDESEVGAELVEGLRIYNLNTAGSFKDEGKKYGGCFGNYFDMSEYGIEISELTFCFPEIASEPVRSVIGTKEILPTKGDESLTPDYRACNNFRELTEFLGDDTLGSFFTSDPSLGSAFDYLMSDGDNGYYYYAEEFTKGLNKLFEDDHNSDYTEEDFADEIQALIDGFADKGAYDIPYKSLSDINLYTYDQIYSLLEAEYEDEEDIPYFDSTFTMANLFTLLGLDPESHDDLTDFLLSNDGSFNLDINEDGIESVDVEVTKYYVKPDGNFASDLFEDAFTDDPDEAYSIPSTYYHKEPLNSTITDQVEAQFSSALPVDDPRFVSFQDQHKNYQEIYYPNVFEAETIDDFYTSLVATDDVIASVPDAESYSGILEDYFDDSIDQSMLNDALAWTQMNIDEKHAYVLSHYLGDEEAYISDPEAGYEIAYLVGDGDQTSYNYGFNGLAKVEDEDTSFNNPDMGYDPDSLGDSGSESDAEAFEALNLFAWLEAILLWVDDLATYSFSMSINTACNSESCAEEIADGANYSGDDNENGVPTNSERSSYLTIDADKTVQLYADSLDSREITVNVMDEYGVLNTDDSFTEVELVILDSSAYGKILSQNPTIAINGVATFTVTSTLEPGEIMLQATSPNNEFVNDSDYTSLASTLKKVVLYTYDIETITTENIYTSTELEDLVLTNENGDILATVDAETGEIAFLSDSISLNAIAAQADEPTRIGFVDDASGETLGVLYVIPTVQEVEISESIRSLDDSGAISNVQVRDVNDEDGYSLQYKQGDTSEVYLWEGASRVVGSIRENGQIFVRDDLGVSIEISSSNFASQFDVYVDSQKIAEVKIGTDFTEPSIDIVAPAEDYLSGLFEKLLSFVPSVALAATTSLPDTDSDGINDLYEYTIGTNLMLSDTDGDSFTDWEELEKGFDPVSANGAPLFTDLSPGDESYASVLELYLRGILTGYEDGSFKPDNRITREEFTKLNLGGICLYCDDFSSEYVASVDEQYNQDPFPDTDISEGLYYCVAESKNEELISGYKGGDYEGYYLPKNYISRGEAAKVILEAAAQMDSSFDSNDYLGGDKPWYYNYVTKAQSLSLFPEDSFVELNHYSAEKFKEWFDSQISEDGILIGWLEGSISRAEFAIMIANLIKIYDCRLDDWDGDGLSNNEEIYTYGTDPNDPDTDDGGITDFVEVVYSMDPLDASDDSEIEYVEPAIVYEDADGDWLFDSEENKIGTDPYNPDTDFGGVYDGAEVLYGTNPLDPVDDSLSFESPSGVYAVGDNWQRDYVYSTTDYSEEVISENVVYITEMPADGFSALYLRAEVLTENGTIDTSDNSSVVEFSIVDPGNDFAEVAHKNVSVVNGVAETVLSAHTVSGEAQITALLTPYGYPVMDSTVDVYPGDVVSMEFGTDSTVMAAGGVNKMNGALMLYDQYKNIANRDPYMVTIFATGGGTLADLTDEDSVTDGIQVTTFEGYIPFSLMSSEEEGVTTLNATYGDVTTTLDIQVLEGINLTVNPQDSILTANGADFTTFAIYANDADGNVLTGFNPTVDLSVVDDTYGALGSANEIILSSGYGEGIFISSTVAGDAYIMASSLGIDPGTGIVTLEPGPTHELQIQATDGDNLIMAGETKSLTIKTYDQYGNFNYKDSSTEINIGLTDLSQNYGNMADSMIYPSNGVSEVSVTAGDISGVMNVVASAESLISGTVSIDVRSEITNEDLAEIDPQVLYATLLGAPVGQVTYEDYFAGYFLFNGKTQAVASLLDYPEPHKRMMQLDASGKSTLIESNFFVEKVLPQGSSDLPMKIVWQDDADNLTLAEILIVLGNESTVNESTDLLTETTPGAYISLVATDEKYELKKKFSKVNKSMSLLQDGDEVARVGANGQIKLFSANYTLETNGNYTSPAINILDGTDVIATVLLVTSAQNDVQVLDQDFDFTNWNTLPEGIYLKQNETQDYAFELSFSGDSSSDPKGYFLVDKNTPLPVDQAPSLGYSSLESAQKDVGVGFEDDNKNILLFSGGNTAGESNKYGVSEIGVLLGDPTISLDNSDSANTLGYTKDIGKILLSGDETIQDIAPLDYNNDGLQDLLVAYESGKIKLLQNYESEDRFKDKGEILDIVSGILSFDHADFNLDGYDDLIIATENSCIAGEICVYLYRNNEGSFERENLNLNTTSQVYQIEAADMNNDDYPDLVASDTAGTITVFYNQNGEIDTEGNYVGNLGLELNDGEDFSNEVYVYYDGVITNDSETPADDTYFYSVPIESDAGFGLVDEKFGDSGVSVASDFEDLLTTGLGSLEISSDESAATELVDFVEANYDSNLVTTKSGTDVNGGVIEKGDEIEYTISITNNGTDISDLYISDWISSALDIDLESFDYDFEILETGDSARPFVLHGVYLISRGTLEFSYSAYVLSTPTVNMTIGNDLDDYLDDDYLDIAASPADNSGGEIVYFYSNGSYMRNEGGLLSMFGGLRIVNYTETTPSVSTTVSAGKDLVSQILAEAGFDIDMTKDENGNGMPDDVEPNDDGETSDAVSDMANYNSGDADVDTLVDTMDNVISTATDVAAKAAAVSAAVEGVLKSLVCGGGCMASPINLAVLSTGFIDFYGIPAGYSPGFPIFGITFSPPWACTGPMCYAPGPFRLYLDITTTLGTAMAVCVGPYPGGWCWAFNLPILQMTGVCDKINTAISTALGSSTATESSGDSTVMNVDSSSDPNGDTFNFEVSANIQIPGFPAVFTEWWKKQKQEVLGLLDLPDIYFIYPTNILGSFKNTATFDNLKTSDLNGLSKFLTVINSIPIIQIDTQPVVFKVPSLSKEEWMKYEDELVEFRDHLNDEIIRVGSGWLANAFDVELGGVNELLANVDANIKVIDEYMEFPGKIIEYRTAEVKLIKQIVCYLDAIITFTGGYIDFNKGRIEAWKKFGKDVVEAVKTWKLLLKIAIDYQDSCDKCTNQRGSLIEFLLKLFLFIPSPPVIDLPKWPDIILDISQIQAGLTISWPDVQFKSEPLILPDLPTITLPDLPTLDVSLNLPSIPVLPGPPDLPDLPDLPGIPIPDLPDIPPPPKVPELDVSLQIALSLVGNILQILCYVIQGLVPVPETQLRAKVEDLTQRPLDVLFPWDLGFGFNFPALSFDFVKRIEIIARMNLSIETEFLVTAVQSVADVANSATTLFTTGFNDVMSTLEDTAQDTLDSATEAADDVTDTDVGVDVGADGASAEISSTLDSEIVQAEVSLLAQALDNLNSDLAEYNETVPDEISIVAEQGYLAAADLQNYDDIAYEDYDQYYNLIADTPTGNLLDLKKMLVAYVEDNESINEELTDGGWDSVQRLLVQNPDTGYLFADYENQDGVEWSNADSVADVLENGAPMTNENFSEIEDTLTDAVSNLFASASEDDSSSSSLATMQVVTQGLFIYNEDEEVNERLINYTGESKSSSKIVSFDMDNDGDEDIVYSYGGTIYLKENYQDEPAELAHYEEVPRLASVDYFLPEITSVNAFKAGEHGNDEATFTFFGEVNEILTSASVGYEVNYYNNLSGMETGDTPIGVISLIEDAENIDVSFQDEAGNEYVTGSDFETTEETTLGNTTYDDLIMVPKDAKFLMPEIQKGFAIVSDVSEGILKNSYSRTPVYENGDTTVSPGQVLHTLEDSEIEIYLDTGPYTLVLSQNTTFPIGNNLTDGLSVRVESGGIEIIDPSETNRLAEQALVSGMLLYEDDMIEISSDTASVSLLKGGDVSLSEGQSYFYQNLTSIGNPLTGISLDNGDYYAQIYAIDNLGTHSTSSNTVLLAPQICADDSTPYADAGASEKDVPIFTVLELDAGGSFDAESDVVDYYIDENLDSDSDSDDDKENDDDLTASPENTVFEMGPYDEAGQRFVKLWVEDEAGNASSQSVTINVYVPDITVDYASPDTGIVMGTTDPASPFMPFILVRDRDGVVEQLITSASYENGKFYTSADGSYEITGFDIESRIMILNADGETVAEFNPTTGQILITDERYGVDVLPTDLEWPTRLIVYEIATGEIIYSIFLATDANTDVSIDDFEYTAENITYLTGVHMRITDEKDFTINTIGASDPLFPGSIEITRDGERYALIASDGNIYLLDENFDLSLAVAESLDEPLVISLNYMNESMGEIYIATNGSTTEATTEELGLPSLNDAGSSVMETQDSDSGGMDDTAELVYGLNPLDGTDDIADFDSDGLNNADEIANGTDMNSSDTDGDGISDFDEVANGLDPLTSVVEPFADISVEDPLFLDIYDMVERGILDGYDVDGLTYLFPDQQINRAEFTKIILAILCIIPSEEAYLAPSVFNDIPYDENNLPWYYDETKESYLRDFITGYLGEIDSNGMAPFKPGANITRAEAVKIILEALNKEGFINLGEVTPGNPWWDPYMVIGQDLTPYLITNSGGEEQFIVTAEEAADPLHEITRYEFIEMSVRALKAYNCYLIDTDGDGLPDWDEINIYGTDPYDADTDQGGVWDGEEVLELMTDPLDDSDDDWDGDGLSNNDESDIYGTDPWDPDTDDGGIWDGVEVNAGTDPLDAGDEASNVYEGGELLLDLEPGVYFVDDACNICPCPSSIENGAQIMSGDIIYTAITNTENTQMYSVSNEYQIP